MLTKEILRQVVTRQKNDLQLRKASLPRDILKNIQPWLKDERVLILTGIRRCGKSTLLKQLMDVSSQWCYLNFEDERLLDFQAQNFETLNEVLIEMYGPVQTYFFDEIQNIEKFEAFVRRLQDEGKKIVLTGSNAALLSKEFGTKLTGRYKAFEVYPFSFSEFLRFKEETYNDDWYNTEKKLHLLKCFEEYLANGGMPEYLKNKDKEYIRTVFENILYKDIITRYSIKREKVLKELINILATNATSPITFNSLKKNLGLSNAITVKEYITYLNNTYLFFELIKFSYSIRQQLMSPKKIYLIDSAFHHVCGLTFTPNKGRNLENTVFIELKRRGKEIFYYSKNSECDFIVKEGTKVTEALQVCYSLDPFNRKREIEGLLEAMETFKLKEGTILTFEQNEELNIEGKKVIILPVAKWMMQTYGLHNAST